MLERLIIAAGIIVVIGVLALIAREVTRRRTEALHGETLPQTLRERLPRGSASILYFFGPHCASCQAQARVLDALQADTGVHAVRIDSVEEAEAARWFGIMTVPTTVIVDSRGLVRDVLPGFQSQQVLRRKIDDAA